MVNWQKTRNEDLALINKDPLKWAKQIQFLQDLPKESSQKEWYVKNLTHPLTIIAQALSGSTSIIKEQVGSLMHLLKEYHTEGAKTFIIARCTS